MLIGLASAALFYGDGMITPAISVLSAVEGLEVATPLLNTASRLRHDADTTLLLAAVARRRWGWGMPMTLAVIGAFLVVDLVFFSANSLKIIEGGWFPLLVGVIVFTLMSTWLRGRAASPGADQRGQLAGRQIHGRA